LSTRRRGGCAACSGAAGLFATLDEAQLRQLDRVRVDRECRRGQVLFYQGEELAHLVCVRRGHVKLLKTDTLGREMVIRFLGPGEVAGFRPLLAGEPSAAAAECVTDVACCLVPRSVFLEFVDHSRCFARHLLALLARELRESEDRWLARAAETAEGRVRRFLHQLCGREGATGVDVAVTVPKQEIARAADITPSTLSRILGRLAEAGLLRVEPRRLVVTAPRRLRDHA